jgi:hypothetical protein
VAYFKALYRYLPGCIEENHEKLQSRYPVSGNSFQNLVSCVEIYITIKTSLCKKKLKACISFVVII